MDPAQILAGSLPNGWTRETPIRRDGQGRWFHGEDGIDHPNLVQAFDRWIEVAPDGRYCLRNDLNWAYIALEGAPVFVRQAVPKAGGVELGLSDGRCEMLDPKTLRQDAQGVLYCTVRAGCMTARFSREAMWGLKDCLGGEGDVLELDGVRFEVPTVQEPLLQPVPTFDDVPRAPKPVGVASEVAALGGVQGTAKDVSPLMGRLSGAVVLLVLGLVGVAMVFAVVDGQRRAASAPIEAFLGKEVFQGQGSGTDPSAYFLGEKPAPDFTLPDGAGNPWRLGDHRGRWVLLNFWSVTCAPCVEEMPSLVELARWGSRKMDLDVVAVSVDSGLGAVKSEFPNGATPGLTLLFDPEKKVVRDAFGTKKYPETWLIDPTGTIRLRVDGKRDWSQPVVFDLIDSLE